MNAIPVFSGRREGRSFLVKPYRPESDQVAKVILAPWDCDMGRYMSTLKDGTDLEYLIRPLVPWKPKSRQLEKFWWKVVVPVAMACFSIPSPWGAHTELLYRIADRREDGSVLSTSDSDFTLRHHMIYFERAQVFFATEFDAHIPSPNEVEV